MVGIYLMMDEITTTKAVLAVQSILFLVAQAFTLTRVSRDWSMFGITDLAKPSLAYLVQVAGMFIIALGLAIYACFDVVQIEEWRGFYGISLLWVTISALCLSKAVRDRADAQRSSELPAEAHEVQFALISRACSGSLEYRVLVVACALLGLGVMLGLMWRWDNETMAIERKGFISVCVLWCEVSAFHLCKLIRDRADRNKTKELRQQLPFQLLVIISSLASFGLLIGGILAMPLDLPKTFFLLIGSGCMLSTAFFMAKHVRDRLELQKLLELPSPETCDLAEAPGGEPIEAVVVEG
eukprot:TRINITY_DN69356_c0_g1_i1.p1 TRINITY_DN69356_c0_g1~~TRINITY_DN69356_c0_g1_i1.p1  ORF type:complete len:344 (+),score=59.51 TRINITY_DN69356_c0_g1_i1:142-1032(+)